MAGFTQIVPPAEHDVVPNDYRSDGDFAAGLGFFCLPERLTHPVVVILRLHHPGLLTEFVIHAPGARVKLLSLFTIFNREMSKIFIIYF